MSRKSKRSSRRRSFSRRAISRSPKKFTILKGLKILIAVGPVASKALGAYQATGGGINGLQRGVLPAITSSYTGYNTNDGKFYPNDLIIGYAPALGAWAFGKIMSRVGVFR